MSLSQKVIAVRGRSGLLRFSGLVAVLAVSLAMQSCVSKAARRQEMFIMAYDRGDYKTVANDIVEQGSKLYGETNAFLYEMDLGMLYHYMGEFETSNRHLQKAAEIYDGLFTRSVTNEAAALLTNDNVRPYRAKPYELITLHQIAALNFMATGDFDGALVETRRAQIHFNEWERTGAKYQSDGMFHLFSSLAFEARREPDNSLISLFKSIKAYNAGPVPLPPEVEGFAYRRLVAGERENDVRTLNISNRNENNGWGADANRPEIIIVGHTGYGPEMTQVYLNGHYVTGGRLRLNAPNNRSGNRNRNRNRNRSRSGNVAYSSRYTIDIPAPPLPDGNRNSGSERIPITIALPVLSTNPSETAYYTVMIEGEGQSVVQTVVVNDIDVQAEQALDNAFGEILLRTVTRVVLRTLNANAVKKVDTGSSGMNAILSLGADVASVAMEHADTRMPLFLPKQMQSTRIPVDPGTYTVSLRVHNRSGNVIGRKVFENVEVGPGQKRLLIHNSLR